MHTCYQTPILRDLRSRQLQITAKMDLLEYATLFLFACLCHGEETPCSRFHYEEQTLEKIVRLEHRFEQLEAKTSSKDCDTTYSCPDTWIGFKGSCYLFPPGLLTFHDAELLCFQLGSNLVHIENEAENNFLKHHMKDLKVSNYWTGLIRDKSGQWIWFDNGETASFTDWSSHSPNNHGGNQDCVYLQESFNFQWNDMPCNSVYRAICELKIEKV